MSKAVSYVWTAVDGITGDLCGVFSFFLSVWAALVRCNLFSLKGINRDVLSLLRAWDDV